MQTFQVETARLRLAGALLSLDGYILSIVVPNFEPGIFFKHVENLRIDITESKGGYVAKLSTIGGSVPWQVIRINVTASELPRFEKFVGLALKARERSRGDE